MKRFEFTEDEIDVVQRLIVHYQTSPKARADVDLYARRDYQLANDARIGLANVYGKLNAGEPVRVNISGRPRTLPRG